MREKQNSHYSEVSNDSVIKQVMGSIPIRLAIKNKRNMNFKKMNPPVQSGINTIDMLPKNTEFHISEVKPGIPCILMNGKVCNLNGIAYRNEEFQETFAPLSDRLLDCKCIAFGKIIDKGVLIGVDDELDFDFEAKLTKQSISAQHMPDCEIIIEDIFMLISKETMFKHRFLMAKGMLAGIAITNPDVPIKMQKTMIATEANKKEIIDFVLSAAGNRAMTAFYPSDGKYIEGASKLNSCQCFYVDPYEIFTEEIVSYKSRESMAYPDNTKTEILSEVNVEYNSTKIELSYNNKKKSSNKLLLKLIEEKKISKVSFRGVEIDGTIKYATPL